MSGNLSSDEEWCVSNHATASRDRKCWECGKSFSSLETLMSHYRSHNTAATCHICNLVFRRQTSLSTHLDNAHCPPLCAKCQQSFSNVWELNKHAETQCFKAEPREEEASSLTLPVTEESRDSGVSSREVAPQQRAEVKPESPEHTVEYTVGEDDSDVDMDSEQGDTTDSDSKDNTCSELPTLSPQHPVSDSDSSTTDCSSEPTDRVEPVRVVNTSMCPRCGRGPYKSLKLHLLHCSGVKVKYKCSLCKKLLLTINDHYMPLYSCNICGQVFSHEHLYTRHQCPKDGKSPLAMFCSETMPKACNICKSFFNCEKTLLNHVTQVHTSVVSRKVCVVSNSSPLKEGNVSRGTSQSVIPSPKPGSRVFNGKRHVAGSSSSSLLMPSSKSGSSSALMSSFKPRNNGFLQPPTNQPLRNPSTHSLAPTGAAHTNTTTASSEPVTPPMPTVLAMFENGSHTVALMKRMNTGWRFKAQYPCRQCGAISRQPSLIISHRYLHRGRRSHQCQCGRTFKHRLHLLRHCVQHAEAISYICVSCGDTFTGARLLAEHIQGKSRKKSRKKSSNGRTRKRKVKTGCAMPFTCDCGQLFFRPSAYIWHQLKNWKK